MNTQKTRSSYNNGLFTPFTVQNPISKYYDGFKYDLDFYMAPYKASKSISCLVNLIIGYILTILYYLCGFVTRGLATIADKCTDNSQKAHF